MRFLESVCSIKIIMVCFVPCFHRFEGVMEVHYNRGAVETEGKRGRKKFMETNQNRFLIPVFDYEIIGIGLHVLKHVHLDAGGMVLAQARQTQCGVIFFLLLINLAPRAE